MSDHTPPHGQAQQKVEEEELSLTIKLITAANHADGTLNQEQIDQLLDG